MKKFVFMIMLVLLLCGCGKKTLKCVGTFEGGTETVDNENISVLWLEDYTFEFNDSGKKLINVTEKTSAVLEDLKYISELENSLKNDYRDFDIPGVHYDITSSDGMVNITANFKIDELPSNFRESIPYNNKTYEELKAYLEQDGYTCN